MADNDCSSNCTRIALVNESFDIITTHSTSSKNSNSINSGIVQNRSNIDNNNGGISVDSSSFKNSDFHNSENAQSSSNYRTTVTNISIETGNSTQVLLSI